VASRDAERSASGAGEIVMNARVRITAATVAALVVVFAPSAPAQQLIGGDVAGDRLISIDRDTLEWTLIGVHGNDTLSGLAYDANHDILYGVSPSDDNVFIVDRHNASLRRIGPPGALGFPNTNGLAYDPNHDVLYATDNNTNVLMTVDVNTGVGRAIGVISGGFTEIEGLGYDPVTDTLYGLTQLQLRIVKIDVDTARAEAVSDPLPAGVWRGLEFDTQRRVLWATTVVINASSLIYTFDPQTRRLERVGSIDGVPAIQGLGFVAGRCTDKERIARARCENGRLKVKLAKGTPGDAFTVEITGGASIEGVLNNKGQAKVKFKDVPNGEGVADSTWACGARDSRGYVCR